jgi:hypothetical protein
MKYQLKTKLLLIIAVFSTALLSSCRDDIEVYNIQRLPVFSFSSDNLNKIFADAVYFYPGKTIIHYHNDGSSEVFKRFLLTANGTNASGNEFTVNIEIDLVNDGTYIGIYRPQYEKTVGGIYSFNYVEKVSGNTYKSYDLDPASLGDVYLRVERQNMEEKLVLGDFFAQLQNDQNAAEKLVFYQGSFKDISYVIQ